MDIPTKASNPYNQAKKHLKALKYIDAFKVNKSFNINNDVSEHEGSKGLKYEAFDEIGTRIGGTVTIIMVVIILY